MPAPTSETRAVFISHASEEVGIAASIAAILEANGIAVWYAPRDITPGDNYPEQIVRAIEGSSAIVVILSELSNSSKFVAREVETADRRAVPIIPFRINEVEPSNQLALFLNNRHWINAFLMNSEQSQFELIRALKSTFADPIPKTNIYEKRSSKLQFSIRRMLLLLTFLSIFFAAFLLFFYLYLTPQDNLSSKSEVVQSVASGLGILSAEELVKRFAAPAVLSANNQANFIARLVPISTSLERRLRTPSIIFETEVPARTMNQSSGTFYFAWVEFSLPNQFACIAILLVQDPNSMKWGFANLFPFGPFDSPCMNLSEYKRSLIAAEAAMKQFVSGEVDDKIFAQMVARSTSITALTQTLKQFPQAFGPNVKPKLISALPSGIFSPLQIPGKFVGCRFALDTEYGFQNLDLWMVLESDGSWRVAAPPELTRAMGP